MMKSEKKCQGTHLLEPSDVSLMRPFIASQEIVALSGRNLKEEIKF